MRFTDYYAEASCTAGRANFITGEIPLRTGLTTVGQAGAVVGLPDEAVTLATVLKSLGYARLDRHAWPARSGAFFCHRHGRSHGDAALGQGRQAEDRG